MSPSIHLTHITTVGSEHSLIYLLTTLTGTIQLVNGKTVTKSVVGNEIATWRPPSAARSITITKVKKGTFAGALVTSVNGIGYFPFAVGSELARIEIPDSNIQVLNP